MRLDRLARVGSHIVIWTIVLVPALIEMSRGWRPYSDDATISFRSFQVLSLHPPLLGQYSSISPGSGHLVFDPGPLQYVLLSLPVHIDKLQGALWGSALIYGLVLSLAIEVMWSLGRWLGCVLVTLGVVDLAWTVPATFGHQTWNPAFGLPFLITSVVLAYAVGLGRFGWWPVLAFMSSAVAQTELFYATMAAGLLIACPFIGAWHSGWRRHPRWLLAGMGVLILCWLPTLAQEVFGSSGNLSNVLNGGGQETHFGIEYGLRSLGFIIWPLPAPFHQWSLSVYYNSLGSVPVVAGLVVLGILLTLAVTAWRLGCRDLATLAAIGLVFAGCVVASFAAAPRADGDALSWLDPVLWLVGYVSWLVVFWAAFEVIRARKRR